MSIRTDEKRDAIIKLFNRNVGRLGRGTKQVKRCAEIDRQDAAMQHIPVVAGDKGKNGICKR